MTRWEANPLRWAEEWVGRFQRFAGTPGEANNAGSCLEALWGVRTVLTDRHRQELLAACERGMQTNTKGCRDWEQFHHFKDDSIPALFKR